MKKRITTKDTKDTKGEERRGRMFNAFLFFPSFCVLRVLCGKILLLYIGEYEGVAG
jgi:hypothetical protein